MTLDYRPSEVARSLKRRSTQTLGLIITDIENPYFPQLVRSVEDAARAAGYAVLLCNAADDPEREASYLELLVDRRVDGLIIAASSLGERHGEWLSSPPIPVVLVNTAAPDVGLPAITSDNGAWRPAGCAAPARPRASTVRLSHAAARGTPMHRPGLPGSGRARRCRLPAGGADGHAR